MATMERKDIATAFQQSVRILNGGGPWNGLALLPAQASKTKIHEIDRIRKCWTETRSQIPGYIAAIICGLDFNVELSHQAVVQSCLHKTKQRLIPPLYPTTFKQPRKVSRLQLLTEDGNLDYPSNIPYLPEFRVCVAREILAATIGIREPWIMFGRSILQAIIDDLISPADAVAAVKGYQGDDITFKAFEKAAHQRAEQMTTEGDMQAAMRLWAVSA